MAAPPLPTITPTSTAAPAIACSTSISFSASHPDGSCPPPPKANEVSFSGDARLLSEAGQKKLSSFPSRQRKMGPAPLASFEDLSMDKTTSDSSSADERNTLPGIEEASELVSPNSPNTKVAVLTVPSSPRIRVSAASSSSAHDTDSKESTPDKELFIGYTKKDYCEEMSDVKTSTEELLDEEARQRRAKEILKRKESDRYEEALRVAELNRKESSSSVISENLLPVTSAHSSRLSSLGSLGSPARRSPSPHRMLLETSFCGNKPIQQPSIDLEDPLINTTNLLNYTIDSLDQLKSPIEDRELSQSPPSIPLHWPEASETVNESKRISEEESSDQPKAKKSQFQERRDKIDQELSRIHQQQSPLHGTPEKRSPHSEHRSRASEYKEKNTESADAIKSRLGKKVLPQEAPDVNKSKRAVSSGAPVPPPMPGSTASATPDSARSKSYSTTPSASPKLGKKVFGRKNKEITGTESAGSTPSSSRKSSFSSLFRRGDAVLSPVTPDSPSSVTGRKSPFKELIKSAKNEMRSRSRSRSRSKSRDRDLEDDSQDKKGVLSIFKPKDKKKKIDVIGKENIRTSETEIKSREAIMNVEFTFNNEQSSTPSPKDNLPRKENEQRKEIYDELLKEVKAVNQPPKSSDFKEPVKESHDSSSSDVSSSKKQEKKKESEDKQAIVAPSYRSVIESLEQRQKEIAEKSSSLSESKKETKEMDKDADTSQTESLSKYKESSKTKKDELAVQKHDDDSKSESERESEIEYYKKKQALGIEDEHSITSDVEIKKLVAQDFAEEDELPYVPTTLPLERSQVAPMIPVKDRAPSLKMIHSIDRPRSTTPIQPSRLDQYRESIDTLESESDSEKLTINIPKAVLPQKTVPKQTSNKSWEDFCQEGLKSPRTIRRQYKEKTIGNNEDESKLTSLDLQAFEIALEAGQEALQENSKNWINFEEIPGINPKPVKQIKTVPPKQQSITLADGPRKPKLTQQKRIDASKATDMYYSSSESDSRRQSQEDASPIPVRSSISTPERDDSSERSSDSDRLGSQSSSEELTTIREKIAEIKKREDKQDLEESSDLERLLAPVNDCIAKLSSLSVQGGEKLQRDRKSPIPDNWADFLLPPQPGRRSRLSSLGSDAGSVGGCRSPSPSHMLLETSFCGSQPIIDPGFAEPNVPISIARKMSGISLGDLSPLMPRSNAGGTTSLHHFCQSDRASIVR